MDTAPPPEPASDDLDEIVAALEAAGHMEIDMPDDLRRATRQEVISSLTYSLRYDPRGKPTRRHNEMMAQYTAEALADMLEGSNLVLMMKPPVRGPDARPPGVNGRAKE